MRERKQNAKSGGGVEMSDKPIPCPYPKSNGGVWCNHKRYVMATSTRQESFYVKCTCGARGPLTDTRAEAIARWNAAGQIQKFWKEQSEWSQQTFGADSDRGPIGPLKHLEKEAREAYEAAPENRALEIVDCLFLSFDAARRHGLTLGGLIELCFTKLAINRSREWPKNLPPDSAVEHYRTNAEGR